MTKHQCIKPACANTYESKDEEAYYCPSCQKANKVLAAQIDAKVAANPKRKAVSAVKAYEAELKASNAMAGGVPGIIVKI